MSLFLKFFPVLSCSRSFAYFHSFSRQLECRLKEIQNNCSHVLNQLGYNTLCSEAFRKTQENASPNEFKKFETNMLERKKQAARSILVQVQSEHSCSELYEYCNKISSVQTMYHYALNGNNHFVLVEFSDDWCLEREVYGKCTHLERGGVPVRSSLLWFRAKGRLKGKTLATSHPPPPAQLLKTLQPVILDFTLLKSWLAQVQSVDDEVRFVENFSRLDDLGSRLRFITAHQVECCLKGMFPHCNALPFGSSVNGFGRMGCDLDLYLDYDNNQVDSEARLVYQSKGGLGVGSMKMQRQMEAIADIISLFLPGCTNVKRILKAKVPIVKFNHDMTALQCDLSMSNMSGVYMSELLWIWGECDRRVRSLVLAVKCWAEAVGITHPSKVPGPWITNFSLTLMAIYYMQTLQLIPTLDCLISLARSEDVRWADDINCTFLRDVTILQSKEREEGGLGELLRGFFEFYSCFDLGTSGLSVCTGKPVIKPDHSSLFIVNPLERSLNVARNVSPKETEKLRMELRNAVWGIDSDKCAFLDLISSPEARIVTKEVMNEKHHQQHHNQKVNRMMAVKDLFSHSSPT